MLWLFFDNKKNMVKTQCFVQLSFNSTLQLINGISSDLRKLLTYFNGTAIVASLKTSFDTFAPFFNNLALSLRI